jgi:RNA-directed DNA polymerase
MREYHVRFIEGLRVKFPRSTRLIVTAENPQIAEKVKEVIKKFLVTRGLSLSEEKTKITNIKDGFDFLGWNFRKYRGKLIITPSKKSFNKIKRTLSSIIKRNKSSTQLLQFICLNRPSVYEGNVCINRVNKV